MWDLQTGARLHELTGHHHVVYSVAMSGDGRHIVSGSDDGTVAVWDLQTGARLASLALDGAIECLTWHPADRVLVPGLTHHNSESGLAGKPCLLVKSKLLDHIFATFR